MLAITPTRYQSLVLSVPETVDCLLAGGRGSGKSYALALAIVQHVHRWGADAQILYVRRSFQSVKDFERIAREIFPTAFPGAVFNSHSHVWSFPNGATCEINQFESVQQSYQKYQGRSFSLIVIDECTQYATAAELNALRSNLRARKGIPVRMLIAANPGGVGHGWFYNRFVRCAPPWEVVSDGETGLQFIRAAGTFRDNTTLDVDSYERQLKIASAGDDAKYRAWSLGEWENAQSGLYFESAFDPARNVLARTDQLPRRVKPYLSIDFGASVPTYAGLFLKVRATTQCGDVILPADSIILWDEWTNAIPGSPNEGDGSTIDDIADGILRMCEYWNLPHLRGVGDDAMWNRTAGRGAPSVADMLRDRGVGLVRAGKGQRVPGWVSLKQMMASAGQEAKPAFYVLDRCTYWLETVPFLARDPRRPDDVDGSGADHAGDATRYALTGADAGKVTQRSWSAPTPPPRGARFNPTRHFDPDRIGEKVV